MKRIGEGRENFSEEKLFPPFPKPHPSLSKDFCKRVGWLMRGMTRVSLNRSFPVASYKDSRIARLSGSPCFL